MFLDQGELYYVPSVKITQARSSVINWIRSTEYRKKKKKRELMCFCVFRGENETFSENETF